MQKPYNVLKNNNFTGRNAEQKTIENIKNQGEAGIVIVYGRRRAGKTELLEQAFRGRNILKFEGIEGKDESAQQALVMRKLAQYTGDALLKKIKIENWLDVFDAIYEYTKDGVWTIYFEELQWLSNYNDDFVRYLKFAWDNHFSKNKEIILILCGSSPSFMINHVIHSKSLYNRSQYDIHLKPFSIEETKLFLPKKSNREVMDAYLTIGGIPEYLKRVKKASSIFTSICQNSFLPNSYFTTECERIFVSSLSESPYYRKIIEYLSCHKFANRLQLSKNLKLKSGGRLTELLDELVLCGFIKKYAPYNLKDTGKLSRYAISDPYLQFYFKFIKPKYPQIESGHYVENPVSALNMRQYQQWLGYAFERFCQDNHGRVARLLGFSGVHYRSGAFYNRSTDIEDPGYQIDLLFDRDDQVMTICEIKYTQNPVGTSVIDEFEKKLDRFKSRKSVHTVLISAEGADKALQDRHYFDSILTLDDLLKR